MAPIPQHHQQSRVTTHRAAPPRNASPKKKEKRKHVVSAAAIFKKPPKEVKKIPTIAQAAIAQALLELERQDAHEAGTPAASESVHASSSPQKKLKRKSSEKHPLFVDFRETTRIYKINLYTTTTTQINTTHATLLKLLHDSTYHPGPATPNPSDASNPNPKPISNNLVTRTQRLEVAKFHLTRPLGHTPIEINKLRPGPDGTQQTVPVPSNLAKRMYDFEVRLNAEKAQIDGLQKRWEGCVGEIWRCGVGMLGEEGMREILGVQGDGNAGEPVQDAREGADEDEGDTLFVPERNEADANDARVDRSSPMKRAKKVTFQPQDPLPAFLSQPPQTQPQSQSQIQPFPALPQREAQALGKRISELGVKHMEDLQRQEAEYQKWWKKKMQKMQEVMMDD